MANQDLPPDLEVDIPVPDGLRVTTDLPYRILVVSDLAGSASGKIGGDAADGVVSIKSDGFDEFMRSAHPSVNFTIADPVAGDKKMVEVNVAFESLRDFDPRRLVGQIPAASALMRVREQIVARLQGKSKADQFNAEVSKAASKDAELAWLSDSLKVRAAPADDHAVDSVLGQLDLGDDDGSAPASPAKPPRSEMSKAVAAAAGGGGLPAEEASALRRTLGEIDRRLCTWLTAVLHAPQVQGIESAWRSLDWLVRNIEFRKGIRLSVLHAPRADMLEPFRTRLIDPVFDEGVAAPSLIVVDAEFSNSAPDMEAIDELAQHAGSLPAVVLAGAAPGFFGVKHAWQIPTLPPIQNMFDQWQFAKWKSLRNQIYGRYLGVVFGRLLMRASYGREQVGDLEFSYREPSIGDKDFVWASGAMAGAYTVARSVADNGWPSCMAGRVHGQIEGLPRVQGGKTGDKFYGPADTQTPQSRVEEMGMAGLNAVIGVADNDMACLWNGLSVARPERQDPAALLEVSLPYQLFAGRLSALLWELKPSLAGKSADSVVSSVTTHVRDWLQLKGEIPADQLSVQVRPMEDAPSVQMLAVTATAPQNIVPGGIPVVMGYRLS